MGHSQLVHQHEIFQVIVLIAAYLNDQQACVNQLVND